MVKSKEINDTLVTSNIEPTKEAFAYCQTCKKILDTSEDLNEVKQSAKEHKSLSGFEDHQAGFSTESYLLTD